MWFFVSFEAEVYYPEDEGIVQIEQFGVHCRDDGVRDKFCSKCLARDRSQSLLCVVCSVWFGNRVCDDSQQASHLA